MTPGPATGSARYPFHRSPTPSSASLEPVFTSSPLIPVFEYGSNGPLSTSSNPGTPKAGGFTLVDAIVQIRSSLNEGEILGATVQALRRLMGVDRVCILRFDRTTLERMWSGRHFQNTLQGH